MSVFFALALALATQYTVAPPKPSAPTSTAASTKGPLVLDVVVDTHDGKPVSGLTQQDFTVKVDKQPEPIRDFHAVQASSSAPVETILLVDAVNTGVTNISYERQQIDRFLKKNNGKLAQPTSIAILTDTGVKITPKPSTDGNQLAATLDKTTIGLREFGRSAGFYGWTEQFQISSSALEHISAQEEGRPGRKLLIWVSPGWPLLSGPEVQLTKQDQQKLFATLVTLSSSLRKARITLSSVDPLGTADAVSYRTFFYQQFEKGVPDYRKMQVGNLALQVLALQSGGRVLNSSNDITGEIARAAADGDAFYTLQIKSAPAEHANEYHSITVEVDKPGATALARTGYYAQP